MSTKLGEKIRTLRKERGMTLDTLATAAGLSKSYLWELENRPSPRPSAEKLAAIAVALAMPATYFIDDDALEPTEGHVDEMFFRKYLELKPDAKEQLRLIAETFKSKA